MSNLATILRGTAACWMLAAAVLAADPAQAQVKLDASYAITAARIPIGNVTAMAEIGDGAYTIAMTGRAGGALRVLSSGEGTLTATGTLDNGRLSPRSYVSATTADDDKLDVRMTFEDGNVTALTASEPPASADRVPLTEAHRRGVVDPLTAVLIPAADGPIAVTQAACQRTLPIFDGRRRYDLKLSFKRLETVKTDKGYAGPVAICAAALVPIAGHRPSSTMVKFLDGREIEMAFAPVAGTPVLAPWRVAVFHMLGNLIVQANKFEIVASPALRASATTGQAN